MDAALPFYLMGQIILSSLDVVKSICKNNPFIFSAVLTVIVTLLVAFFYICTKSLKRKKASMNEINAINEAVFDSNSGSLNSLKLVDLKNKKRNADEVRIMISEDAVDNQSESSSSGEKLDQLEATKLNNLRRVRRPGRENIRKKRNTRTTIGDSLRKSSEFSIDDFFNFNNL